MSDFAKLEAVIKARTPGPWRYAQMLDGYEARLVIDGSGYQFARVDDLENGTFIAAIGTLADLMLDVVKAAEITCESITATFVVQGGLCGQPLTNLSESDMLGLLKESLSTLCAALEKLP